MRLNQKIILGIISTCIFIVYWVQRKNTNESINMKQILEYAISASERGGDSILKSINNMIIKKKGLTKEGLEDRVTNADLFSHCSMVNMLKNKFSNLNIVSEESNTICPTNDYTDSYVVPLDFLDDEWVKSEDITIWIDPLDATHEFTEKLYQYVTTMVCVALKGKPVIGVIHKPFQNSTSWAWVGKTNSADLNSREKVTRQKLKISISRSHGGRIREMLDNRFNEYELIVAAGAGFKSLQVAYGEVDAYLHSTAIKKWDICAGNAILEALGGQMTDKENQLIDYTTKTSVINEKGLIATLKDHSTFLDIL